MDRNPHWIRENRQERIPPRMIVFDTESKSVRHGDVETQTWRTGCAIRWRTDLKTGDHAEAAVFITDRDMWEWIASFCKPETRTVAWAHNLGHDVRIASALTILPQLGFQLEWSNLDRNVSCMTWRSPNGTLVLCDTYTWLPLSLAALAPGVGLVKFKMPGGTQDDETWAAYCMRDAQILYRIVRDLLSFIRNAHLGNWQPTGAGMAYATWRHKFLREKVLVHADTGALEAERAAMHTGRAEAWRHGLITGTVWTEVDMTNAYLTIGRECELPRKLHYGTGRITLGQYRKLADRYRVLCQCDVFAPCPVVPARIGGREMWPEGNFTTWLWDTEIDCALKWGCQVSVRRTYVYARSYILREWATWCNGIMCGDIPGTTPIVRTYAKHSARALIGRVSLKTRRWETFGTNPEGITGISRMIDPETGTVRRMMHAGNVTMIETDPQESDDSIPMVTSWIMSECRVRLWEAMATAGLDHIAHVDTDSLLTDPTGLDRLRTAYGWPRERSWHVKGSWSTLDIYGPRRYLRGKTRVVSGLPAKAEKQGDGSYLGERWASMSSDLEDRGDGIVTTRWDTWTLRREDPRRRDAAGAPGMTASYEVGVSSDSIVSSLLKSGCGA